MDLALDAQGVAGEPEIQGQLKTLPGLLLAASSAVIAFGPNGLVAGLVVDHPPLVSRFVAVDAVDAAGDRERSRRSVEDHLAGRDRLFGVFDPPTLVDRSDLPLGHRVEAVDQLGHLHLDGLGSMTSVSDADPFPGGRPQKLGDGVDVGRVGQFGLAEFLERVVGEVAEVRG